MVKVAFAAVAGTLLLGALGACGDDPKPKIADPTSSPSESVTPSAPQSRAAETPEAFLRRYIEAAHKAEVTGRLGEYKALSDPNCVSCNQFIDYIQKIHRRGGAVKFGGEDVIWIHRLRRNFYKVRTYSPPTHYKESKHGPWKVLQGGNATAQYSLGRRSGHFVVTDSATVGSGD